MNYITLMSIFRALIAYRRFKINEKLLIEVMRRIPM